jgi:hypothetical protein
MKLSTVLATLALLLAATAARGETFVLASGGRLEGKLVNAEEKPRQTYVIKLASGGQISLAADQVKEVLTPRPEESQYEKIRPQYPDTVDGQRKLAAWCLDHGLTNLRRTHLRRIIELDPNDADARHALGYAQVDGQWVTPEELRIKQGYRLYKGVWMLPQQIELIENKRKQDVAEKTWFQKIKLWRGWLGTKRDRQARDSLQAIDDPSAVKALAAGLKDNRGDEMRSLFVEILGRVGTSEAIRALSVTAIDDADEELRLSCLDQLKKKPHPDAVSYFVGRLRDKDNVTVNRAGVALARMKDPSAIGPLIEALVTIHKAKIGSGNPGQMTTSFPTGGSRSAGGMGTGMGINGAPKIVHYPMYNQSVLDALVNLTGQNFNFDQRAWRSWYSLQQRKGDKIDARRG